jgi:putative aminopeptidase FrvX
LARRTRQAPAPCELRELTQQEEIGATGALYFTRQQPLDALIALEIAPISSEYIIEDGAGPVLFAADEYGHYHEGLNADIRGAARSRGIPLQLSVVNGFGSDGSFAMKEGHVPRAACLGFPTQNTHGFEIARLDTIGQCIDVLEELSEQNVEFGSGAATNTARF